MFDSPILYSLERGADRLLEFMAQGGSVMWLIAALALILWSLIFERIYYFNVLMELDLQAKTKQWFERQDRVSKMAQHIRNASIASLQYKLEVNLKLISSLIVLCPLLGLLGTVSGMILVFDVIAFNSMGDTKMMANGVSQATIPTMASMVIAISGIFAQAYLSKKLAINKHIIYQALKADSKAANSGLNKVQNRSGETYA